MPAPLVVPALMSLASAGIGLAQNQRAKREADEAFQNRTRRAYSPSGTAVELYEAPISQTVIDRVGSQIERDMSSGIQSAGKGGSRTLGAIPRFQSAAYDAYTNLGTTEAQMRMQAGRNLAGQEQRGAELELRDELGNVAGYQQEAAEGRGMAYKGISDFARNLTWGLLQGGGVPQEQSESTGVIANPLDIQNPAAQIDTSLPMPSVTPTLQGGFNSFPWETPNIFQD